MGFVVVFEISKNVMKNVDNSLDTHFNVVDTYKISMQNVKYVLIKINQLIKLYLIDTDYFLQ